MTHFRKIWNEKTDGFIKEHYTHDYKKLLSLFLEAFPDSEVTETALRNECSRLRLNARKHSYSTKKKPLLSEHVKKGYVKIKIAQPSTWISKAKYVYMQAHPDEDLSERSNYIFLDGNNRNFSPDNIARVRVRFMGVFSSLGGTASTPEETLLRVRLAELKVKTLDAGSKLGLCCKKGTGRMFKEDVNRRAREYRSKKKNGD